MRIKLLPVVAAIGMAMVSLACQTKETEQVDHSQADALYVELHTAYRAYADSMESLTPSDTIDSGEELATRFEKRLSAIYRKYPADLDESLSPLQNDSLWHYANRYIKARKRLNSNSYKAVVDTALTDTSQGKQADSIPAH